MAKSYEFNWQPVIPNRLLKGELFDRWDEVIKSKIVYSKPLKPGF
jgi:hypothetical protein